MPVREVLELHQRVREVRGRGQHELLDQRIVIGFADPALRQADVERVVEQLLVLGADVERDGEARLRMHAGASGVERQLADGDAHAVRAEIAQAEDALAVSDHDHPHGAERPVLHDPGDPPAIAGADEQAAGAPPDVAEPLAGESHGRGVDDRQHLVDVVDDHTVEQRLVAVLQGHQVDVLLEVRRLAAEVLQDLGGLLRLGEHARRQEAGQVQRIAFLLGECSALVERRVVQQQAPGRDWSPRPVHRRILADCRTHDLAIVDHTILPWPRILRRQKVGFTMVRVHFRPFRNGTRARRRTSTGESAAARDGCRSPPSRSTGNSTCNRR